MGKRIPMVDGDEVDALSRGHHGFKWRSGERKRIKRKYNRRERQQARLTLWTGNRRLFAADLEN